MITNIYLFIGIHQETSNKITVDPSNENAVLKYILLVLQKKISIYIVE